MANEEVLNENKDTALQNGDDAKPERERSTIGFPYGDLNDAVAIVKGVRDVGGSSCEWEQLAAKLGQVATGGGFRQKALTAKSFGLVTYSQNRVTLTSLGNRICDPKQEKPAKAEAFLCVPLYKAVYEKFKGTALPPTDGLEAEMVGMGVSKKQKEKVRQCFQRSAMQAGFFWSGQDRLVLPAFKESGEQSHHVDSGKPEVDHGEKPKGGGGEGGGYHPLIEGLIKTLPMAGDTWAINARRKWLQAAANNFDLIYETDDVEGVIKIEVKKDSAN